MHYLIFQNATVSQCHISIDTDQGRSENLKEVPQSSTEFFNIDDVTANDVIWRNQHYKQKKT